MYQVRVKLNSMYQRYGLSLNVIVNVEPKFLSYDMK